MGEAAHGPAGVDFADAMPLEAFGCVVEEGVDTDGAVVLVFFEEPGEGLEDLFFCFREDLVGDEAGVFRGEAAGGLWGGGGGEPLTAFADLLMT